ncbi:hypothetical protein [Spirochaeta dissipatitropha]
MNKPDFKKHEHLRSSGFIKTGGDSPAHIDAATRAALIRKGNELFNNGRVEQAKRVFITVSYGDGLTRIGHHYAENGRPLDAFRMYWIAGDKRNYGPELEKMAMVIRQWLTEDS